VSEHDRAEHHHAHDRHWRYDCGADQNLADRIRVVQYPRVDLFNLPVAEKVGGEPDDTRKCVEHKDARDGLLKTQFNPFSPVADCRERHLGCEQQENSARDRFHADGSTVREEICELANNPRSDQ
jgi:hypothetical protein